MMESSNVVSTRWQHINHHDKVNAFVNCSLFTGSADKKTTFTSHTSQTIHGSPVTSFHKLMVSKKDITVGGKKKNNLM